MSDKLTIQPYKGVRDFYPEDEFIQRYIKNTWREVVERFGYQAYDASILEPLELYQSKTSSEIVNEQTYNFTDRGDREITLRPEMTPTVARIVAGRSRELGFPLRLYSIPNLFRYERPQRGRLREHWQLNCDLFGDDSLQADIEILQLAHTVMENFGISSEKFTIVISSRKLIDEYLSQFNLPNQQKREVLSLIDSSKKDPSALDKISKIIGGEFQLESNDYIDNLIAGLEGLEITNVTFDQSIARGFDYYTGMIFEVFDTSDKNPRSLFGGGRYDNLMENFEIDPIPAVGFGMGDVTIRDVLETYDLLPEYVPAAELTLIAQSQGAIRYVTNLATELRKGGLNVETDTTLRKLSTSLKHAGKRAVPFVSIIGDDELVSDKLDLKNMKTGKTSKVTRQSIAEFVSEELLNL